MSARRGARSRRCWRKGARTPPCGSRCSCSRSASACDCSEASVRPVPPLPPFELSPMAANDNLDLILRRHQEIAARLAEGVAGAQYSALSREFSELEPVVAAIKAFL